MPLTVFGVRHGEVHNPERVIYAGLDGYGLSEAGRRQAEAVAEALSDAPVAAIYSSPLDRAIQTAEAIAARTGAEIVPDERLYEWRYWGQWAGMTWEELRTKGREAWEAYQRDPGSVTAGESLEQLADRAQACLSDIESRYREGIVVVVTHLEPLRATLLRMLGRPATDLFAIEIGVCQVVRLLPEPDDRALSPDDLRDAVAAVTKL